jgi:hypothetical protein
VDHQALEKAIHGIKKRVAPVTFATAAADWLKLKKPSLAPRSLRLEQLNIDKHLKPALSSLLLIDLTADDISTYQRDRLRDGASPKTINLEVGTLRAILGRHRLWAHLQPDVKMLIARDDAGQGFDGRGRGTPTGRVWAVPLKSPATGRHTGAAHRDAAWRDPGSDLGADRLSARAVDGGQSKTESGQGGSLLLNATALKALQGWATNFPDREPEHFVFAREAVGLAGNDEPPHVHSRDPKKQLDRDTLRHRRRRRRRPSEARTRDKESQNREYSERFGLIGLDSPTLQSSRRRGWP